MIRVLRNSGQLYNYPVYYERIKYGLSAAKAQTTDETIKGNRTGYVARLTDRTIQTLWQIQLPLSEGKRSWSSVLSFSQYAWRNKTGDNLCSRQIQNRDRKGTGKLSKSAEISGRNQQYQPRVVYSKSSILNNMLWYQKWKKPP